MKSFKVKQRYIIITAVIFLLSSGMAGAGQNKVLRAKKINSLKVNDKVNPQLLMIRCDLKVNHISAGQCFCGDALGNVGAMLFKDIWVNVGNYSCGTSSAAVNAQLDVQYFDLMLNRLVKQTFQVSLAKNRQKDIKIKNGYTLIKKSSGITANIKFAPSTSSSIRDCNPGNNRKIERQCQLPLVY